MNKFAIVLITNKSQNYFNKRGEIANSQTPHPRPILPQPIRIIIISKKEPSMRELQELDSSTKHYSNSETLESSIDADRPLRPKYGNLIVLFRTNSILLTIGPDYICFLIAIVVFSILYYFTVSQVYAHSANPWLRVTTLGGAIFQLCSYFLVALSNPGVTTVDDFQIDPEEQIKRICKICDLPMLPRSKHCSDCGVCIKGYDHHCPWTSKCIGQNNIIRFYVFACYTPLFIIYCVIVLGLMAAPTN